jgi:biopolymer transport protein ExbD
MNIMLTAGINVMETKAGVSRGKAALKDNISLRLTKDDKIFLDNKEVEPNRLLPALAAVLPSTKDGMVIISADDDVRCEKVVDVLDMSKKCGARKLALMQNTIISEKTPDQSVQ